MPAANRRQTLASVAVATTLFCLLGGLLQYALKGVTTATSDFAGLGVAAVPAALVYAVVATSLPEELLFRSLLLKRLASRFGYLAGNLVQSLVFGLLHGALLFAVVSVGQAVAVIVFTSAVAFVMGHVNEQKAAGSILPSWFIHASANLFSAALAVFSVA